jgi:hypothetical protein
VANYAFSWENAYVEENKIINYLLDRNHAAGGGKAKFFLSVGYSRERWTQLRDDLLLVAREGVIFAVTRSDFGTKTVIDGSVVAPSLERITLRTVWINGCLDDAQRLVTAYPN